MALLLCGLSLQGLAQTAQTGNQAPGQQKAGETSASTAPKEPRDDDFGVLEASGIGQNAPGDQLVAYQVGAFALRTNAENLIKQLGKLDLVGHLYRENKAGSSLWIVLVAAAPDPFENREEELKQGGFSALPIDKDKLLSSMELVKP